MRRKGQVDVQFSWIFILIAGGVILGLFFKVATTQRQIAEDKAAVRLMNDFDALTKVALQSRDTVQPIPLSSLGLHFSCDDDCGCFMHFGRQSLPYEERAIFAPPDVDGEEAFLWVADWKMPYRASNMLYIANDNTKFFFITDEVAAVEGRLKSVWPLEVSHEVISSTTAATNENYDSAVFVFMNSGAGQVNTMNALANGKFRGVDVRGVEIGSGGSIYFIEREGKTFKRVQSGFVGNELMYGAIFSGSSSMYNCNVKTAFTRLLGVTLVSHIRTAELMVSQPERCQVFYLQALCGGTGCGSRTDICENNNAPFCVIEQASRDIIGGALVSKYNSDLLNSAEALRLINERLLRQSCAVVY